MTVVELTGTDFKKIYFPKYREFQDVTEDTVKDAKRCSDTFHDFLVNSPFFSGVSCFRVYDNDLFSFYKQAERCLKSGRTSSLDIYSQWVAICGSSMICHRFLIT